MQPSELMTVGVPVTVAVSILTRPLRAGATSRKVKPAQALQEEPGFNPHPPLRAGATASEARRNVCNIWGCVSILTRR